MPPSTKVRPYPLRVVPRAPSPPPTPMRPPLASPDIIPLFAPPLPAPVVAPPPVLPDDLNATVRVLRSMPAPVAPVRAPSRWRPFEKLGLVAPKLDPRKLSRHVVTVYRLLGFAILTIIVIVLVGYIAETTFFYLSDSWIVPMAISPTDDKVVALQSQLTERQNV